LAEVGIDLGPRVLMPGRVGASAASPVALWILVALATVWFLRAAKTVLIPIALAVLISYALEPIVGWLERRRVPRALGSAAVLVCVLGGIVAGAYTLKDDATQLVAALPEAAERARDLVSSQLGTGAAAIEQATGTVGRGAPSTGAAGSPSEPAGTSAPIAGSLLERAIGSIFSFAGHLVVIVFLVFFLLISGHRVKDRLIEITGPDAAARRTTAAIIGDINAHIQRYLLVLLCTSAIVGASTWLVLALIGVEHAAMWGLLAGIFNSIPYFGPVVVSGGLFVVGLVQGGDMTAALQMAAAALAITSLEGWLVTPPLLGKFERMNALAVFLGLLLWTWVWGAWGTILAVPILVIVKSTADHVQQLRPIGRLMAP
jgi:predicted PurR-regulated permease PerM